MINKISKNLEKLWGIKKEYRLKVLFLSLIFLSMTACQAIWRPLKTSIFAKLVGSEYVPNAKILSILFILPLVILYSKLVDILRRHQLLYYFNIIHAVGGIIFYFLLSNPVYGLPNTQTNPNRLVGWALYFFMESFAAFLSTSFWSFVDSVNNPKDAKNFYGFFVAGSKIGAIITAGSLYVLTTLIPNNSDHILLPNFLLFGSFLLFGAATSVFLLMKKVPGYIMHGYEAAYKIEKKREKEYKKESFWKKFKNMFAGVSVMIKNPYVLGIFSLVLFYEITIVLLDYRVLCFANATHLTVGSLTSFYALYYLIMHSVGLIITLLGTTPLLRIFGIRFSLMIFPITSLFILFLALLFPTASILFATLVILRALNYGLNHPTREALYIPTNKDIKFKAKAWTDAFGGRLSKTCGSFINKSMQHFSSNIALFTTLFLSVGLISGWLIVVYFLGKTLQKAITNKQVIGEEKQKEVATS